MPRNYTCYAVSHRGRTYVGNIRATSYADAEKQAEARWPHLIIDIRLSM